MKRFVFVLFAFVFALAPAGALFAQSDPADVFCGDLAEEDCALLVDAAAADQEVAEGAYDMVFDFELNGVPNAPMDDLAFTWMQTARYRMNPGLADAMMGMEEMDPMMMADMDTLTELMTAVVENVDTHQDFTVQLSDEIAGMLSEQVGFPLPEEINLGLVIVDGIGYVNLDDIAVLVPDAEGLTGWVGTELAPVLAEILAQAAEDPDFQEAMAPLAMAIGGSMAGSQMADEQAEALEAFQSVERGRDADIDGEEAAVFSSDFDFVSFISSPIFFTMLTEQLAMMGDDAPSAAELQQVQFMMPMIAPMLFGGLNFAADQYVGLDSGYTLRTETALNWDLSSLAGLAAMTGDPSMAESLPSYFGYSLVVDSYDQNDVGDIEAPADAVVVDADMLVDSMQ